MRTMLISLILICSLAQFAHAEDPVVYNEVDPGGCGTVYTCYAPKKCKKPTYEELNDPTKLADTMEKSDVVEIKEGEKVLDDCDAIIRFHQYSDKLVYASISSFQEPVDTSSITFTQKSMTGILLNEFSCSIDADGKRRGKYASFVPGVPPVPAQDINVIKFEKDNSILPSKLMCDFKHLKKTVNEQFFQGKNSDVISITTKNEQDVVKATKPTKKLAIQDNLNCDPSYLDFNLDIQKPGQLYEKVLYSPGKYECPEDYTLEYRKDATMEYQSGIILTCDFVKFEIRDSSKPSDPPLFSVETTSDKFDKLDVRCVADVKFFCNYPVLSVKNETNPVLDPPNVASKKETALKCPSAEPHLIIVKGSSEEPIKNAQFECVKYGKQQLWTVEHKLKNMPIKISKDGPVVKCSKTVKCSHFFAPSESAISNGFLDDNLLPRCHDETGTLLSDGKKVSGSRCNGETGQFMYTVDGAERVMDKHTKFVCNYPPETEDAKRQDEENKQKLTTGITGAIAGGITAAALVIAAFIAYSVYKDKKNKKKIKAQIYAEKIEFGSKSVKEAARKAKKLSQGSQKPDPSSESKEQWNDFVVSTQQKFLARIGDDADGNFIVTNEKLVSDEYYPEKEPKTTKHAISAKVKIPKEEQLVGAFGEHSTETAKTYLLGVQGGYTARDEKTGKKPKKKE